MTRTLHAHLAIAGTVVGIYGLASAARYIAKHNERHVPELAEIRAEDAISWMCAEPTRKAWGPGGVWFDRRATPPEDKCPGCSTPVGEVPKGRWYRSPRNGDDDTDVVVCHWCYDYQWRVRAIAKAEEKGIECAGKNCSLPGFRTPPTGSDVVGRVCHSCYTSLWRKKAIANAEEKGIECAGEDCTRPGFKTPPAGSDVVGLVCHSCYSSLWTQTAIADAEEKGIKCVGEKCTRPGFRTPPAGSDVVGLVCHSCYNNKLRKKKKNAAQAVLAQSPDADAAGALVHVDVAPTSTGRARTIRAGRARGERQVADADDAAFAAPFPVTSSPVDLVDADDDQAWLDALVLSVSAARERLERYDACVAVIEDAVAASQANAAAERARVDRALAQVAARDFAVMAPGDFSPGAAARAPGAFFARAPGGRSRAPRGAVLRRMARDCVGARARRRRPGLARRAPCFRLGRARAP
jgi:hypothetical protein